MKRVLIVIPLLLGVVLSCKSKEKLPEVEAYDKDTLLDRGWKYYRDGKYDSAVAVFDSIINEIDPSDMEAHLGLGLSYAALGYYSQAHGEFSLIYSRYLTSLDWTLNLHVDPIYEDTIGNTYVASSNAQLVGKKKVRIEYPRRSEIIVGQWRLGKILRLNNVYPSDTTDYIYLITGITEYTDIIIKPAGSSPRTITSDNIRAYTDGLTYADSFMAVVRGKLQIIDTIGPVLFVSSKYRGDTDTVYLHSWLANTTPDTITMNVTVYRFPRTGFPDPIVWMAVAADAHTYYIEGANYNRSYSLALIAYYTRNLIDTFPSRIRNLPGLSDGKEKKALAAIIAQSSFKNEMFANTISIIRAFIKSSCGDYCTPTFPTLNWTYRARTKSEIDSIAYWTRGVNNIKFLQKAIFDIFFQ